MQMDRLMLLVPLGIAAFYDKRARKIPNHLILYAALFAVLWRTGFDILSQGVPGGRGLLFLLTFVTLVLLLQPLFFFHFCGGGDTKLMALILAWLPPKDSLVILLLAAILILLSFFLRGTKTVPLAYYLFLGSVPILMFP